MTKETLILWYDTYIKNTYPLCTHIFMSNDLFCVDYKDTNLNIPFKEIKEINLFVSINDDMDYPISINITCKSGVYFSVNIH